MHRLVHKADGCDQAVGADFRNGAQGRVQRQTQKLKGPALGEVLLELATHGDDFLGRARISQQ